MNRPIDGRLYIGGDDAWIELGPGAMKVFMTQAVCALRPTAFRVELNPTDANVFIWSVRIGVDEQLMTMSPVPAQFFAGVRSAIADIIPGLVVAIRIENKEEKPVYFRAWFEVEEIK